MNPLDIRTLADVGVVAFAGGVIALVGLGAFGGMIIGVILGRISPFDREMQ